MRLPLDAIVATDRERERDRRQAGRRRIAWTLLSVLALVGFLALLWPRYRITVSITRSLPWHAYLLEVGRRPQRGDIVAIHPPGNRFYPDGSGFMKIALGIGGDRVRREGRTFFVNGARAGEAKARSRNGLPLEPGPTGSIPAGCYFVWTPAADSFDSRYADIGWIADERVVGVAVPLF